MYTRLRVVYIVAALLSTAVLACGDARESASPAKDAPREVVRELLQSVSPSAATGQDLHLTRVVIPAGTEIAAHTHPGPQLAVIVEGTLTYSVIRGEVQITRHAGTPQAAHETAGTGQTVELQPGDSLLETPAMVHTARNAGNRAVVIYLSSLFPTGAPASSPAQ